MPAKREVVGLWPRFYATIWLLCHRSREHIFVIARSNNINIFCCPIAMSEQFYCHLREKRHILDVVLQEATATSVLLRHIPKGDAVIACKSMSLIVKTQRHNIFLMLRKAVVLPGCNDSGSTIARREEDATIKFFMLSIKG